MENPTKNKRTEKRWSIEFVRGWRTTAHALQKNASQISTLFALPIAAWSVIRLSKRVLSAPLHSIHFCYHHKYSYMLRSVKNLYVCARARIIRKIKWNWYSSLLIESEPNRGRERATVCPTANQIKPNQKTPHEQTLAPKNDWTKKWRNGHILVQFRLNRPYWIAQRTKNSLMKNTHEHSLPHQEQIDDVFNIEPTRNHCKKTGI